MRRIQTNVRTNDRIRADEVLVISPDGERLGVLSINEALRLAQEEFELDLVEVAPNATPPVCRIMDYGRWRYEQEQKMKRARKAQTQIVVKEIKLRPKIDKHDLAVKQRKLDEFLRKGQKVKVLVRFRGREIVHPEIAERLLLDLKESVAELSNAESLPKMDGRTMVMMLAPLKKRESGKKAEKVAEDESTSEMKEES